MSLLRVSLVAPLLILSACSMMSHRSSQAEAGAAPAAANPASAEATGEAATEKMASPSSAIAAPSAEAAPGPGSPIANDEMKITLKKEGEKSGEQTPPAVTHAKSANVSEGVPAIKALGWLKNGNRRFVRHALRNDGQSQKDVLRLASGQTPHSIILSCSDSRVPPEIVFDQKLGEIFVVRTAGPSLDPAVLATIEYAVAHLHPHLLVVMGHTQCGAIKAALSHDPDAGSPYLNGLVAAMRLRFQALAGKPISANQRDEGWANVAGVSEELISRSEIIRGAVGTGELKIQSALYDTGHGKVDFKED